MPTYRFFGRLYYPAIVHLKADSPNQALIRTAFGDFDSIEKLGEPKFLGDPESEPEEVREHEKPRRFRAIFKETVEYAVEFSSSQSLRDLLKDANWRDELDRWATSQQVNWQQESAIHVEDTSLEHLEEISPRSGQNGPPLSGTFTFHLIAIGICRCGHSRKSHLEDQCQKCSCQGFLDVRE